MPRSPRYALIWSPERRRYALSLYGQPGSQFRPEDDASWLRRLHALTSFAFHGHAGHLNVHKEARTPRAQYWYAYAFTGTRMVKRYLGQTTNLTFARLEEVARDLARPADTPPAVPPRAESVGSAQAADAAPATHPNAILAWLPATKLALPRLPAALVARERLLHMLDAARAHRLTLLSAPAGWGKTMLLSAWAARHPQRVAWVSLDPFDNDPIRFWTTCILALRAYAPGVGAQALALLSAPTPRR